MRFLVTPSPHKHFVLSASLLSSILMCVEQYLIVLFNLYFWWLMLLSIFSHAHWTFIFFCEVSAIRFAHFQRFAFFLLSWNKTIFWMKALCQIYHFKYFLLFCDLSFDFLYSHSKEQICLTWIRSNFSSSEVNLKQLKITFLKAV